MAYLLHRSNSDSVAEQTELLFGTTSIGRGLLADVRMHAGGVGRNAAQLKRLKDGNYALLPSDALVKVNGVEISGHCVLNDRDLIEVGDVPFEFRVDPEEHRNPETIVAGRRSLLGKLWRLGAGTMASRLVGLGREVVMASYFGAGAAMDVFQTAFLIPNLFRRILGESAMESAFLPTFKTFTERDRKEQAWSLASTVLNLLAVTLSGLAIALYFLAPLVVKGCAPGFSEPMLAETVKLTRMMLPFTVFIGIAAFLGSLLLAKHRDVYYSLAPTLFGMGAIAGILIFYKSLGLYALGAGILLGGAGQMFVQFPALWGRPGERYRPIIDLKHPGVRKSASLMGPIFLTSAIDKLGDWTKRLVASFLMTGSLSALTFATRLVHLPFAVLGLALSRGVVSSLAEENARNDLDEFRAKADEAIRMCTFLMLPASVGIAVLARPLVETVFAHGNWLKTNPEATSMTAWALVFLAAGLWPMSMVSLLNRCFHAMLDTRTPLIAAVRGFYLNIILSISLGCTGLGHLGLALAVSVDYLIQVVMLFTSLRSTLAEKDSASGSEALSLRALLGHALRIGLCTAIMGVVVWLLSDALWQGHEVSVMERGAYLLLLSTVGGLFYAISACVFGVPEANRILRRIRRR